MDFMSPEMKSSSLLYFFLLFLLSCLFKNFAASLNCAATAFARFQSRSYVLAHLFYPDELCSAMRYRRFTLRGFAKPTLILS